MKISDIVNRQNPPQPWEEGEKIPWDEPDFSKRMLKEHLSQDHNAASRRFEVVHRQVDWLERLAGGLEKDLKVLDLACGPGLHSLDFARRGHSTYGIDFSPASIEWAQSQTEEQSLSSDFVHGDIRNAEFGTGYDLAILLFGEMNVFTAEDLSLIARKTRAALNTGGMLMLEPHEPGVIRANFETAPSWSAQESGLFSDRPHMLIDEGFWHDDVQMAVKRWYVVDSETNEVTNYSQTVVEHTKAELVKLIEAEGFTVSDAPGGWPAGNDDGSPEFYPLVAVAK
ncbi:MAG: class I SAM-dependent methyltransferase [Chloroflexi bacterium]|jgi:SAM-dependent methyltransferase|nr:class I SAM-dependent methyltransferase [Chloroflexota bacterium]